MASFGFYLRVERDHRPAVVVWQALRTLANEIVDQLEAALAQFAKIAARLKTRT
ncbi:MAG: hypothetical protein Q8O42_01515 [Acidobacteriota bacterium]|nr:hypothetical protein [Acidobacteriota bacterium]